MRFATVWPLADCWDQTARPLGPAGREEAPAIKRPHWRALWVLGPGCKVHSQTMCMCKGLIRVEWYAPPPTWEAQAPVCPLGVFAVFFRWGSRTGSHTVSPMNEQVFLFQRWARGRLWGPRGFGAWIMVAFPIYVHPADQTRFYFPVHIQGGR